jgi:DNA-directed RNA polymerase specialized sigma24 family protein
MQAAESSSSSRTVPPPEVVRDAFGEVHGRRLHGFALLVTLGDRSLAAQLAGRALAEGMARIDELRHPERAAAWLRRRVVRSLPHRERPLALPDRRAALDELGVDDAAISGLAAISPRQRAAVVAADVERIDLRDVATIAGVDPARLESLLRRARGRYLAGHGATTDGTLHTGPISDLLRDIATRALR